MSQTISVGVASAKYWAFMATVMATRLEKVVAIKRIEAETIPKGVCEDAKRFFNLVLAAAGDKRLENPPASINAYRIAGDVLRKSAVPAPMTRKDTGDRLRQYGTIVERLAQPAVLGDAELKITEELREFFLQLAELGDAEVYARRSRFEPPDAGRRRA